LESAKVDLSVRSKNTVGYLGVGNLITSVQETTVQIADSFAAASSLGLSVVGHGFKPPV